MGTEGIQPPPEDGHEPELDDVDGLELTTQELAEQEAEKRRHPSVSGFPGQEENPLLDEENEGLPN